MIESNTAIITILLRIVPWLVLSLKCAVAQDGFLLNCTSCPGDGTFDEILSFGTLPCGDAVSFGEGLQEGTEECTLFRAANVQFCGCAATEVYDTCYLCGDQDSNNGNANVQVDKYIPDAPVEGLTCRDLLEMPTVDAETCPLLQEKYQAWCGCPNNNAPERPSCSFCEVSGEAPNLELPYLFQDTPPVPDASCKGLYEFFSVQTEESCPFYQQDVAFYFPIDIHAYCECPQQEIETPVCAASYCPVGEGISTDAANTVVDDYFGITCGMLPQINRLIARPEQCEFLRNTTAICCGDIRDIVILTENPDGGEQDGASTNRSAAVAAAAAGVYQISSALLILSGIFAALR